MTEKALHVVPSRIITLIKKGASVETTESQKKYRESRSRLFNPHVEISKKIVNDLLETRSNELKEAIKDAPLGSATDRNGFPLGSLLELSEIASRELNGELKAKHVLRGAIEMITDEEELKIKNETRNMTKVGAIIGKDGSILLQKFPNRQVRNSASRQATTIKENFLKGKERLQGFIADLD